MQGVSQCFLRRKRLADHHEQGRFRPQSRQYRVQFGTIDIGDEVRTWTIDHRRQRDADQPWPEIRTANANVDDVGNALAGRAAPATVAYALGALPHAFSDFVDPVTAPSTHAPNNGQPPPTQAQN